MGYLKVKDGRTTPVDSFDSIECNRPHHKKEKAFVFLILFSSFDRTFFFVYIIVLSRQVFWSVL